MSSYQDSVRENPSVLAVTDTQDRLQLDLAPNPLRDVIYSVADLIERYAELLSEADYESPNIEDADWLPKS